MIRALLRAIKIFWESRDWEYPIMRPTLPDRVSLDLETKISVMPTHHPSIDKTCDDGFSKGG